MTATTSPGKLQIAPKYLFLLLLPVVVLTASEYILGTFGDTSIVVPNVTRTALSPLAELSARYKFLSALFFFIAVAISMTAIFVFELFANHTRRSILYTLIGIFVVILVSLSFSTIEPEWMPSGFESHALLGDNLFHQALEPGQLPGCAADGALVTMCDNKGAYFALKYLLDHANIFSSLAAAAVIAGMVLSLSNRANEEATGHALLVSQAQSLEAAQSTVQRYLYCSGILLTTGMVLVLSWMKWPSDMIADEATRIAHDDMLTSLSMFRGVTYTVLILSFYLPVSLLLKTRIDAFKAKAASAGEPELAAKLAGFDINRIASLDAVKTILAIASPILTSAIGSFVELSLFE
ncbi:hypothetical protein [Aliiroseovarius sp. 2305UL8-7]|uniref:hypothetical protein n=1 Tax=Aliiroseovarius conchicola TaxID=3121637 RepID=UPI0035297A87